ncbi:MAG: type II secretion system protein [Elusimicrobia bacterium]|nr:type II secretion system protein [Elusimicrobiota bacterium]
MTASSRTGERGFGLLELVFGIAIMASLGLVLASLLTGSIASSGRSAQQAFALSNARKVLAGSGPVPGMLGSLQEAREVAGLAAGGLTLLGPGGSRSFAVSPGGELLSAGDAGEARLSMGIASLSVGYYTRDESFQVVEASSPQAVGFVMVSFSASSGGRGSRFVSGARLMNRP